MSRAWASQQERSNTFWLRTIIWTARHLGRPFARALLYPITAYFVGSSKITRQASRQYLRKVLQREPDLLDVYRHHHCFASVILDRVFLLAGREHLLDLRIHGYKMALEQLAKGRGAILLGSHLGSFEALRVLGTLEEKFSLKVLMIEDHNQMITRLLNMLNPEIANSVIGLGQPDTFLKVKESLEQQQMIGMLGDRVVDNDKKIYCDFLGQRAGFPAGPLQLAMALKVPVVLFYGLYQGGNRYDVHFELLTEAVSVPGDQRTQMLRELTCEYARQLQIKARQAPWNWFNFYDFWAE